MHIPILVWLILANFILSSLSAIASDIHDEIFFDAEKSLFSKEDETQIFEGEVLLISKGIIIAGDKIIYDRKNEKIHANGHVVVIDKNHLFTCEDLLYNLKNKTFKMSESITHFNNSEKAEAAVYQAIGISEDNIKQSLTQELANPLRNRQEELKKQYKEATDAKTKASIEKQYALTLKSEILQNKKRALDQEEKENRRASSEKRKAFWLNSRKSQQQIDTSISSYFRVEGKTLEKNQSELYIADDSLITPCLCDDDETPAWAFRSSHLTSELEGYAKLSDAVLEIKGIPVFYLPFLIVPMKTERQSGLLFPSINYNKDNGTTFSQPMYFALTKDQDLTLTTSLIERRGPQLNLEYRWQQKTYSGWITNFEIMRDRMWLKKASERQELINNFSEGYAHAQQNIEKQANNEPFIVHSTLDEPSYWQKNFGSHCLSDPLCLEQNINLPLSMPSNLWRGRFLWNGNTFISPRVSIKSNGELVSDHRYIQDIQSQTIDIFLSNQIPNQFNESKFIFNVDQSDYYFGLGSSYADFLFDSKAHGGLQIPLFINWQSRYFPIINPLLSAYVKMHLNYRFLDALNTPKAYPAPNTKLAYLDSGNWSRGKIDLLIPLKNLGIFSGNVTANTEARYINGFVQEVIHDEEKGTKVEKKAIPHTLIDSSQIGLNIDLPIHGGGVFGENEKTKIDHDLNWHFGFSLRPYVHRNSNYGEQGIVSEFKNGQWENIHANKLVFFPSDIDKSKFADYIADDIAMSPQQKFLFGTSHGISFAPISQIETKPSVHFMTEEPTEDEIREQARTQLSADLEKNITQYSDLFDPAANPTTTQYSYQLESTNHQIYFDLGSGFDLVKNKRRGFEISEQMPYHLLTEPWDPLNSHINLSSFSWKLNSEFLYNFYKKNLQRFLITVIPPNLIKTDILFTYQADNDFVGEDMLAIRTDLRTITLRSKWSNVWQTDILLSDRIKHVEGADNQIKAQLGLTYLHHSSCWGMRALWQKDYAQELPGSYFLSLIVRFFKYDREFGNMASRFNS